MNKKYICLSAVAMLTLLATSCSAENENTSSANSSNNINEQQTSSIDTSKQIDVSTINKDETVYVITNPNGSKKNVIVADWLQGITEEGMLQDKTTLEGIKNVKGNETFDEETSKWTCLGQDIHYQGKAKEDATLPFTMSIEYKLNGEEVTPEEIAGKDGDISMHFTFTNNATMQITEGEESVTKYVPFAMLSGMMLSKSSFSEVSIDNGKIEEINGNYVAVGYALPKLNEDLGLTGENAIIPEEFTINAKTTNFNLETVLSYADSTLINKIANSNVSSSDDEAANKVLESISSFVNSLATGESSLYASYNDFLAKEQELKDGLTALSNGVDQLYAGMGQLDQGLDQLTANDQALIDGATQTFNALLAQANQQIAAAGLDVPTLTIENYSQVLNATIQGLSDENVTAQVKAGVRQQVVQGYRKTILAGVLASSEQLTAAGVTADNYDALCEAGQIDEATSSQVDAAVNAKIDEITEQQMQTEEVQQILTEKLTAAAQGRASLQSLLEQLNSYNTFYTGLKNYIAGVETVAANVKVIYAKLDALVEGTHELASSLLEITDQLDSLKENITEEEVKFADVIAKNVVETVSVSSSYYNYSGITDGMSGTVRFVYRSDAIKA